MSKPKKITIETLAGMMNNAFTSLDKKMTEGFASVRADMAKEIGGVNTRLDGIDIRLDGIDVRLDGMDERLEKIEFKVNNNNENRISRVEDDIRVIKTKLEL